MGPSSRVSAIKPAGYRAVLYVALIAAGLAGNYFNFSLFLNINFLFGSIFAMLALQYFGLRPGIAAAALIASYTYFLWNEPYAIVIMTAEVAVVGWLMASRKTGMVLADALYWLVLGMPLGYLFYKVVLDVSLSSLYIIMTKQAVNGIANALLARLMFTGIALRTRSWLTPYREIVYNLLVFFVLCPALIMLAIASRNDFAETDQHIRATLIQDSKRLTNRVETWVRNRESAIVILGEMAASRSPQQMQSHIEQAKKSDANFLRVGLTDKEATSIAYYPLIDELGQSNIGRSYADRPYIPALKRSLKPMLSEVVMGRVGAPKPFVALLAPVIIAGEYGGYAAGILSLEQIREHLRLSTDEGSAFYTLLDKNGNVIMTNRTNQTVMKPFVRDQGTLNQIDAKISQWVPVVAPNTSISERWKDSFYVAETSIGDLAEWKLILEQPVAPFQKTLYNNYAGKLIQVFIILLGALALAELLSRRLVATTEQLSELTHDLPATLDQGGHTVWPESAVLESNRLIGNFKEMAQTLAAQFGANRQLNATLEQRVEERTRALRQSESRFRAMADGAPVLIWISGLDQQRNYFNQVWLRFVGRSMDHEMGNGWTEGVHAEDLQACLDTCTSAFDARREFSMEYRLRRFDGNYRWVLDNGVPLNDDKQAFQGYIGSCIDITEHKENLAELKRSNADLEQFAYAASHDMRQPLRMISSYLQLLDAELAPVLNDETRQNLFFATEGAQRMDQMLTALLDYSRVGRASVAMNVIDSRKLVDDALRYLGPAIMQAGAVARVEGEWPQIVANHDEMLRLLQNLIDNAVKYRLQQRQTEVVVSAQTIAGEWRVAVRDNGVGLLPGQAERLFKVFERLQPRGRYPGTGIGLALCRKIVEHHHGRIWVESSGENQGCTFTFALPMIGAATIHEERIKGNSEEAA